MTPDLQWIDWTKVGGSPILVKGNAVDASSSTGAITINRAFNLTEPGVLSVSANTTRFYNNSDGANSGALITITVNGANCAEDSNFERETNPLNYVLPD